MSEYQYYEFQAIDRPLTAAEKAAIEKVSSRVSPSSTKATFTYSYGDFPRDEKQFLAQYFDAMFYIAKWGTLQLMFRFPTPLLEKEEIQPYCLEDCVELSEIKNYTILSIYFNTEEGFGWIEEQEYLDSLIDLRNDILHGDYRVLYLTWLKAIKWPELDLDENTLEPPVPPQLNQLSPALKAFAEIFEIDEKLIQIGAQNSQTPSKKSDRQLKNAIAQLSREECNDFLWKLLQNEPALSFTLKKRLSSFLETAKTAHPASRTAGEILESAKQRREETKRRKRQESRDRYQKELQKLSTQQEIVWQTIEQYIQKGQAKFYDEAVSLLVKLRDLAQQQDTIAVFNDRLAGICDRYSRRSALLQRLKTAKLL